MILNIVIGLLGLGIVVFFHEAGHLLAAKATGIEVEAFSIGWGRKIFGFTHAGTEYRLSLFPIGGYCKMKGEDSMREAWANKAESFPHDEGSFMSARPWQRIIVLFSGPLVNVLFAIVVFAVVWGIGFSYETFENRIVLVDDYETVLSPLPARDAGLKTGDRIVAIDGEPTPHFRDIQRTIAQSADVRIVLTIERDGSVMDLPVVPTLDRGTGAGQLGIFPWIVPVVAAVRESSAADIAGFQPGDAIIAVDGEPVSHSIEFSAALDEAGQTVAIEVTRNRSPRVLTTVPGTSEDGRTELGVTFETVSVRTPRLGVFSALGRGAAETWETLALITRSIALLFGGVDVTQAVAGPIRITYFIGEVTTQGATQGIGVGITAFFNFLSLISVTLFLMNLLPIPALDGGQIVLSMIEMIKRSPLRPRFVYRYQFVGTMMILFLIVFALFNDVLFLVNR
ncbi:MAG: RIP metalloprotease RseP [Spirochaetaceae bacterium]|nr:MAG: RIP metalloprotease RseP [Spirochaetaceae bacterium]